MTWEMVDEGWGRRAVDFSTLLEPACSREYLAVHDRLGLTAGVRLLDVACGSGLALELAGLRGAMTCGIDASARLVAVARDRSPNADIRVGDMGALPWSSESFDVVTSFRGIWGTTPTAVEEARRVLVPGGRLAMTVFGDLGKSPGAWVLLPFMWATDEKLQHMADMSTLDEAFLVEGGFQDVERFEVPYVLEFADPEMYARSLAASGPAYEAIQSIGEEEWLARAIDLASTQVRDGLPLRAALPVIAYVGTKADRR